MGKYTAPVEDYLILPATVRPTPGHEHLLRLTNRNVPAPFPIRLLLDTGAKRTTLVPGILHQLDAPVGHDVRVITPLAAGAATLFWVRLEFPESGLVSIPHLQVARLAMPPGLSQFHGLLGRDLLRRWDSFLYEGRRGRYTLRDTPGGLLGWLRRR